MRVVCSVIAAVAVTCAAAGCGPKVVPTTSMERQQKYGRIAIVCAPAEQANPSYAPMILKEAESRIFPLKFLEKAECLADVSIDTTKTPSAVLLDDFSDYDAVVALVYSYNSGHVYLDFYMTDTMTGKQIWNHQFDAPDPAIKERLCSQGLFVPAVIKKKFYGL
ncbi:MAG TPA: hypothetical protein DIU00_08265 [Phycisphaerales bacterium]|nr:hypothetical protein [Phycisphaerales bacterium]